VSVLDRKLNYAVGKHFKNPYCLKEILILWESVYIVLNIF